LEEVSDDMVYVMLLAHLIGDYLFQTAAVVRWKMRSLAGVVAHGAIVTVTSLVCSMLVAPPWWPYAVLIGLIHTAIDVVRARVIRTENPGQEMAWYLLDQLAHMVVIWLVVTASGNLSWSELTGVARHYADPRFLLYAIGYLLLANPAWVLLRFTVRGLWGAHAAPRLDQGEKWGPMAERIAVATCILAGQLYLVPLVLLPRRLTPIRIQGRGIGVLVEPDDHWAETILSIVMAIGIGLALRLVGANG
jgi:hypothetical protein